MADLTFDDIIAALKGSVRPYDNNLPNGGPPRTPPAVNPTRAFDRPAPPEVPNINVEAIMGMLRDSAKTYDNNLPNGGPPRARAATNTTTKGEIEAARAPAATLSAEDQAAIVAASGGGEPGAPTGAVPGGKPSGLPAWLTEYLDRAKGAHRAVTGPVRAAANAVAVPVTAAYDLGNRAVHGAFGLEPETPMGNTGERVAGVVEGLGDAVAPFRGAGDAIKARLIAGGARPLGGPAPAAPTQQGAFVGPPAPPAEGPAKAMTARPRGARAATPVNAAEPQGGAFARTATEQPAAADAVAPATPTAVLDAGKEAVQSGAFAQPQAQPQAPREGLAEQYRRRMAGFGGDPDGKMSEDQKNQLALTFFLNMMAKSAQPGARALGAFGEAGVDASKEATAMQDKNYTRGRDKKMQARDDIYKEMGFAHQDSEGARADRRATTEENRWKDTKKNEAARLQLLRDQFEQGKLSVQKTSRGMAIVSTNGKTIPLVGSDGKQMQPFSETGGMGQQERYIRALASDPKLMEAALQLNGRDVEKGAVTERDLFNKVMEASKPTGMGGPEPQPADVLKKAQEVLRLQRGGAPKGYANEAEAHAAAREALKGKDGKPGKDPAAVNKRLQEWGYRPVQ